MAAQDVAGAAGTPASAAGALPGLHIQSDTGHADGGDLINHFIDFAFARENPAWKPVLVLPTTMPPDIGGGGFSMFPKTPRVKIPKFSFGRVSRAPIALG